MANYNDPQLMNGLARDLSIAASGINPTTPQMVGLIIEYVGSAASCLITTSGGNVISSAIGASGAEAADPNFTVGGVSGTIDLTQPSVTTMGGVVDFINSLSEYRCRLVALRRGDTSTTTGYLLAVSAQQAKVAGVGLALSSDTANSLQVTAEISILDGAMYSGGGAASQDINTRTIRGFAGLNGDFKRQAIAEVFQLDETLTYTGAGTLEVVEVDDFRKSDRVVYTGSIPGASTAAGSKSFGTLMLAGLQSKIGRRLLVRCRAATTLTAVTNFVVYGKEKSLG